MDTSRLLLALPDGVRAICQRLEARGFRAWVVGGCVRDLLRKGPPGEATADAVHNDWDLCTSARPDDVIRAFRRVIPTGLQHGTVTVVENGQPYEVTTLRGEATYSDARHPDAVYFVDDLAEDLARRDFTVNALAYDPLRDELTDPFGGLDDLRAGVLRAVGEPAARFAEDGLRVLRAARFVATLEFDLDPATAAAIEPSLASYRLVSPERIRDEWLKALKAPAPSRAFALMLDHGLLGATAPELLPAVKARGAAGSVWSHALRCVDRCPRRPLLRLAALLHDVARPDLATGEAHATAGADLAQTLLERLRFSNREQEAVGGLVRSHAVGYDATWADADVRRWILQLGPATVSDVLELAAVDLADGDDDVATDASALAELEARIAALESQGFPHALGDLALDGRELMRELDLKPGREVGELLRALLDRAVEDPALNQRDRLLLSARQWIEAKTLC